MLKLIGGTAHSDFRLSQLHKKLQGYLPHLKALYAYESYFLFHGKAFSQKVFWFFLLVSPLIGYTQSKEITEPKQKVYPPYPDIWGYDLSEYPAFKWGGGGIQAYRMDDGDVWFILSVDYKKEDPMKEGWEQKYLDKKYLLIKFFKQEKIELTEEERWRLSKAFLEKKHITYKASRSIIFKSGENLIIDYDPDPKLCTVPDFISHYLVKEESDGRKKKYSILAASPQVEIWRDQARCEVQGAPFIYQKLYFLPLSLFGLEDDTFLVFTRGSNLILRFDKNLETHFQPKGPTLIQGKYIDRNFFVLDYSVIEKLGDKYISEPVPLYQAVHDALLIHLRRKYNNLNEEDNNDY